MEEGAMTDGGQMYFPSVGRIPLDVQPGDFDIQLEEETDLLVPTWEQLPPGNPPPDIGGEHYVGAEGKLVEQRLGEWTQVGHIFSALDKKDQDDK